MHDARAPAPRGKGSLRAARLFACFRRPLPHLRAGVAGGPHLHGCGAWLMAGPAPAVVQRLMPIGRHRARRNSNFHHEYRKPYAAMMMDVCWNTYRRKR